MKFCSACVLPDSFPGIDFDEKGVCNYCRNSLLPDAEKKAEYKKKLQELIDSVKGRYAYDVIMAYSGGKDSTYTMYSLAHDYGLKILSFTLDNGFISEKALENITRMTDLCGATSMIVRPPFGKMKSIFKVAATEDLYNTKTLDRASSICTTCIGFVKSMVLKKALNMNIPLAAYGWSPGQAPITSAIMKTGARLQRFSNSTVRDPILKHSMVDLSSYFLTDDDMSIPAERWPVNIHPLAFMDYNEENVLRTIESLGWQKPSDTDPNSSNCTLNALANYLHRQRFNFHPYAWEIAGIVRAGGLTRAEGIEKTTEEESMPMVKYAARRLDLSLS
jgi:tRNA(Ile)-lysidine synthase TilS/MesJ